MGDWQPIETAPKDGTWCLVFSERAKIPAVAYWVRDGLWMSMAGGVSKPAFWMSLPIPPSFEPHTL